MIAGAADRFHERVVDEHIDELAFLLHLRQSRMPFSAGDVREWLAFDQRLAAHIDGLLLREQRAWPKLLAPARARPRAGPLRLAGIVAMNAEGSLPAPEWLALATDERGTAPWADEVTRWVLPERRARALEHLAQVAAPTDLRLALSIELSNLLQSRAPSWQALLAQVEALGGGLLLTARALGRISVAAAAPALAALCDHPSPAVRQGACCGLLGLGWPVSPLEPGEFVPAAAAGLEPLLPIRAALRQPTSEPELHVAALWQQGQKLACALAAAAIGTTRLLPGLVRLMSDAQAAQAAGRAFGLVTGNMTTAAQMAGEGQGGPAGEAAVSDAFPHLPQPDAAAASRWLAGPGQHLPANLPLLHGNPRDDAQCLETLRCGDALERLLCAEVLAAKYPGFAPLDVQAPMFEQLSHPAMTKAASSAPEPVR